MQAPGSEDAQAPRPAAAEGEQQRAFHGRRYGWLVVLVLVLLLAAVLGVVVGATIAQRGRSFGTLATSGAAARPTFVVAAVPSASASPSASPEIAEQPPIAYDEYVVESGDTLRSIAERVYGDAGQWSRIYDANRAAIGPNPDTINAGTPLRIPRP